MLTSEKNHGICLLLFPLTALNGIKSTNVPLHTLFVLKSAQASVVYYRLVCVFFYFLCFNVLIVILFVFLFVSSFSY